MSGAVSALDVEGMVEVLETGADTPLSPGLPVTHLDHALQTAALLAHLHPGDDELAAAGLVHDIGHLLPGGTDEAHATDAARAVRQALGERVAATVGLHVAAKRYLVSTDAGYGGVLTEDSVVSLGRQGGAMTEEEAAAFLALPWASDAVTLRRADDSGKVEGLVVGDLASFIPLLRSEPAAAGRRPDAHGAGAPAGSAVIASGSSPRRHRRLTPLAERPPADRVAFVDVPVSGHCDARFGAVRDEFIRNFAERGEVGAALCILVDGGLWSTWPAVGPMLPRTRVASTTRWSTSIRSGRRSSRSSRCSWSTPGSSRWTTPSPGCGRSSPPRARKGRPCGTRCATGPGCRPSASRLTNDDLWDWDRMAGALAATAPWWEPGTRHAYHTNTYGHLIGEVVRRVSGETCGRRLAALAGPLEADLLRRGPASEQHRCAEVIFEAPGPPAALDDDARGRRPHGDAELLQPAGLLLHGRGQHGGLAQCGGPVDQRARLGARRGTPVRRAARTRPPALARPAGRGDVAPVRGLLPDPARGRHLRLGLQADGAAPPLRPQSRAASAISAPGERWGSPTRWAVWRSGTS